VASVGGQVTSRELRPGIQLVIYSGWESDPYLVDGLPVKGTLPGEGCTAYTIVIMREGDRDSEEILQEFDFRGGGDLRVEDAPAMVWQAFNQWHDRLLGKLTRANPD
jgi:hypothetical protein